MEEEYVSIPEAIQALNIRRATLYRLLAQEKIETYRFPGKRQTFIKKIDLERLRRPIVSKSRPTP